MAALWLLAAVLVLVPAAQATLFVKTNNATALNVAGSWTNNAVPGAADIAQWDATVSDVNNTTNTLGGSMSWSGIKVVDPIGSVVIVTNASGNVLTLGAGGIDMSAATQNLTIGAGVTLSDYAVQTWSVPTGRTLSLTGPFTRSGGAALTCAAGGTVNMTSGTYSNMIGYLLYNGTDVGAWDISKNISSVGSVIGYTAVSAWNQTALQQFVDMNSSTTATGTTDDINCGTKIWYPRVIHFNAPQPNRNYWAVNAYNGQIALNANQNTVLVTTNVGACNVIFSGVSHAFRWGQSSGTTELCLDQENTAGDFICNGYTSQKNVLVGNIMTKFGQGRAIFNAALWYSGPTRILNGELMLNNTVASPVIISSQGVLSGTGTISGSVTNLNGGAIWAGTNGLGALTLSNGVALKSGSGLKFYSSALRATNATARLIVKGALTVESSVTVSILAGSAPVGQYPLLSWTNGVSSGDFAKFSLGQMPLRTQGYLSNNVANYTIDLVVTNVNQPVSWAAGGGVWDLVTSNWQDLAGTVATYQELNGLGDAVLFADSLSGSSPVLVTNSSTFTPASVTVNASKNYVLSGSGKIAGPGSFTKSGSGTLTLGLANSFSGGLNLNAGVVNFSALTNLGSGGINFGGGTLQYNANSDDISVRTVWFGSGGGTIDTGGNAVTLANPVGNSGVGGLTKSGANALTLNGTNKYSGPTVVQQGNLVLGSATTFISNSVSLNVSNGAVLNVTANAAFTLNGSIGQTLTGSGSVLGNVICPAGAAIFPGASGGTLTMGNLTLTAGTNVMDINSSPALSDLIVCADLTLTSGTIQLAASDVLTNGVYKLIQYSGTLVSGSGSSGNLNVLLTGTAQPSKSLTLSDATAGEIDLIVATSANDAITWNGSSSANWDTTGVINWGLTINATPWAYTNGDAVVFNEIGIAASQNTVQLQSVLQPGSITVSNDTASYTWADGTGTGVGKISGPTKLVKKGANALVIQTDNNNTGSTDIQSGTVQVGNGGIGDIGTGNITNNGALVFNQNVSRQVAGVVSGSGPLTQQGGGTLTLAASNTYSGPTTISSGSLQVGAGGAAGSLGSGAVTNDGTLIYNKTGSFVVGNIKTGPLYGGALSFIGAGTASLTNGNTYVNNTVIGNGVVKLAVNDAIPSAATVTAPAISAGWLVLDGGGSAAGRLDLNGFNQTVNALSGLGSTVNGIITNSGASTTTTNVLTVLGTATTAFAGSIPDNATGSKTALVLLGANTLSLSGVSTYSGGTYVGGSAQLTFVNPGLIGNNGNITLSNGTSFLMQHSGGSAYPNNNLIIPNGATATLNSSALGNGYGGNISGGANSTNVITGPVSFGVANVEQYSNFLGTVVVQSGGTARFSSTSLALNGGENTTFDLEGTGVLQTRNQGTVRLGALIGNGFISNPQANTGTGIFEIGFKNTDTTFSGAIQATNAIVKVGTGRLTLNGGTFAVVGLDENQNFFTNLVYTNLITYVGNTTISNGVLALAAPVVITNSPVVTLASATAVLDASQMGYADVTLTNLVTNGVFEVVSGQTLAGIGTIRASKVLLDSGSTFNVGLPVGSLTATNEVELAGFVNLRLSTTNSPNSSQIICPGAIAIDPTATLNVTNVGPALAAGNTFQLFSHAVTGSFAATNLPVLVSPLYWTNKLAVDGSLVVASLVNTSPTNLTSSVSGGNLTLTWPADHTGWRLQSQTNSVTVGLATNWVDVAGATATNQVVVPMSPVNGSVFYRMVYP